MRWPIASMLATLLISGACAETPLPTRPSPVALIPMRQVSIEAETGVGDGHLRERSRASGGLTLHLGPGERRQWVFPLNGAPGRYAASITYANGQEGDNETMTFAIDGVGLRSWRNRDSGDAVEGWNLFITDAAGTSSLSFGTHTMTLEISGGDGCVEIDRLTLTAIDEDTDR